MNKPIMMKNLLLVDFENRQQVDLSTLDRSYSAVIFVGNQQNEPKIRKRIDSNNKYVRINYQKVSGFGKNALDFHIAFKLGQIFETAPDTHCYILSADQGFDPLLKHLNENGLNCRRVESILDLPKKVASIKYGLNQGNPELTICGQCKKSSTIEHNGGRWCTNCGRFASPPDTRITSNFIDKPKENDSSKVICQRCRQPMSPGDWDYDDDELICWGCLAR
jgi:uncharacterized CHY-type Zn-finger protein